MPHKIHRQAPTITPSTSISAHFYKSSFVWSYNMPFVIITFLRVFLSNIQMYQRTKQVFTSIKMRFVHGHGADTRDTTERLAFKVWGSKWAWKVPITASAKDSASLSDQGPSVLIWGNSLWLKWRHDHSGCFGRIGRSFRMGIPWHPMTPVTWKVHALPMAMWKADFWYMIEKLLGSFHIIVLWLCSHYTCSNYRQCMWFFSKSTSEYIFGGM